GQEWWPAAGSLEASISVTADAGELTRVAGDLQARDLQLAPGGNLAVVAPRLMEPGYGLLGASFEWDRAPTGWELDLTDLTVDRGGRRWESPAAGLALRREGALRRILVEADTLQVEDLLPGLRWVRPEVAERVLALAPAGRLSGLDLRLAWPEEGGAPREFSVASGFEGLAVRPAGPWPGVENLSGYVAGNQVTGSGQLDSRDASIALPRLFREPLELASASGRVDWRREEDALVLSVPTLQAANDDAAVTGGALLRLPAGDASPRLEIEATARDVNVAAAPKYLPVGIMPAQVVSWLDRALGGGRVPEAQFVFEGDTRAFPFRDDEGLFRVEFDWEDGILDYSPGWPPALRLAAAVRFENEGLFAEVGGGELAGVAAGPVAVAIPDLRRGELSIRGSAAGSLASMREFVMSASLLRDSIGPGVGPAEFTAGSAEAEVDLALPLRSLAESRARVDLEIRGGVLNYEFLGAPVQELDARLSIDNARVDGEAVTATLAGSPVAASVATGEDGAVRLELGGSMNATQLGQVLRLPVAEWAEGRAAWDAFIRFPAPGGAAPLQMGVGSDLAGMAIALPAPVGKPADQRRTLEISAAFPGDDRVELQLDWDESLRLVGRLEGSDSGFAPGVVPGAVEGEPSGLVISGAVSALDLGGWLALPWTDDAQPAGMAAWVAGGRLLVGRMDTPLSTFDDMLVELVRDEAHWEFQLSSERAAGGIRVPFVMYGEQPVEVRLERLWIVAPAEEDAEADAGPAETAGRIPPDKVPPLDLEVDDLRYHNIRLGSISALTLNEGDGFELVGLEGVGDGFMLQANGRSRLSDTVDASRLDLSLRSDNVGQGLEFMGFRRSAEAARGTFEASVEWQGGLRRDWLAAIVGEASLAIEDGTLVGVEPGAGRVFGLLSIQELPRRLALDFEDVFGEGTAFDRISGDFRISGGNAYTQNLVMRGPAAEMGVVGRAGFVARDYDQTAVISADLGRTLPVAGTVVGGPVVGAALFILSEMLQQPFETQLTYRITGPWDEPVIERLSASDRAQRQEPPPEPPQ
ncbi:MAG: YhdP family protein, partial [Gammaproteobacteria bacterium]